jgi:hypothetical protein
VDITGSPGQAAEAVSNAAPAGTSQSPQPSGVHQTIALSPAESNRTRTRNRSRSRSRAATDRLPIVEAHRKEKLLKLQALQSQVQMMEREIEESLREEERLRIEAIDQSSGEDDELDIPPLGLGKIRPEMTSTNYILLTNSTGEMQAPSKEAIANAQAETPVPRPEQAVHTEQDDNSSEGASGGNESVEIQNVDAALVPGDEEDNVPQEQVEETEEPDYEPQAGDDQVGDHAMLDRPSTAMEASPEDDDEELSDAYEPPEAQDPDPVIGLNGSTPDLASTAELSPEEASGDEIQEVSTTTPITHPISNGMQESKPASPREVDFVFPVSFPLEALLT